MADSGKRRVCVITGGHWKAVMGGAQFQAKLLVEAMIEDGGFDIHYLARDIDASYQPDDYAIERIPGIKGLRRHGFVFDAGGLGRALRKVDPDIIYQRGLQAYTGIAARFARRHNRGFMFHIARDDDVAPLQWTGPVRRRALKALDRKVAEYGLRHADWIIAQTHHQADLLRRNFAREAAAVIPNFHPYPEVPIAKAEAPLRVVWVANFKPEKGPEKFVELARQFADREDVKFVMIGRPGEANRYRSLHEAIARLSNLEYWGERTIDEVNRELARAHLFVNTSGLEGFPNTFIQAWMRKVPTLSLGVDIDGVLEREGIGMLGGTEAGLRACLARSLDEPEMRQAMGERAQAYAFKNHSPAGAAPIIRIMRERSPPG